MDVWPSPNTLPKRHHATQIHDHIFSFTSTILCGVVNNIVYDFEPDEHGHQEIYAARYSSKKSSVLQATGIRGNVLQKHIVQVTAGGSYSLAPLLFHTTTADGLTASLLRKDFIAYGAMPRVLCPPGFQDTETDREQLVSEEELWNQIFSIFP